MLWEQNGRKKINEGGGKDKQASSIKCGVAWPVAMSTCYWGCSNPRPWPSSGQKVPYAPCNAAGYPSYHQALPPISRKFFLGSAMSSGIAMLGTSTQAQVYNRVPGCVTAQEWQRGAILCLRLGRRPRGATPSSKERRLRGRRRAERSYPRSRSERRPCPK